MDGFVSPESAADCWSFASSAASDSVTVAKVDTDFNAASVDLWAEAISESKDLLQDPNSPERMGKW